MIFVELSESLQDSGVQAADELQRAALTALEQQAAPEDADVTVLLTDNALVQDLNRQYLGIDAPTDVLSFPSGETDPDTGHIYLGDVIIAYPQAAAQAEAAGHAVEAELQLLAVHGVLHLLGFDHAEPQEKAEMWSAQSEILNRLGIGHIKILNDLPPEPPTQ
jgi:probable rRNA maturation factor